MVWTCIILMVPVCLFFWFLDDIVPMPESGDSGGYGYGYGYDVGCGESDAVNATNLTEVLPAIALECDFQCEFRWCKHTSTPLLLVMSRPF